MNDKKVYKNLKSQLETEFKMTDMSLANHYLGIELHQNANLIIIKQTEFIKKILHQFDMKNAVLKPTSMNNKICLDFKFVSDLLDNIEKECYQSSVESLIYLMLDIRSDISFAVSILSQFTAFSRVKHAEALNHIFCYLHDTFNVGIIYTTGFKDSTLMLYDYTDADFAGTVVRENRCSTSEYILMLSDGAIS